jgi:Icc-related predicted phosphoesterase
MKIWHISDTHNLHGKLSVPQVDCVIFSGDCSLTRNLAINSNEVSSFIDWYANLPIKYKVFVGGNHDISIERSLYKPDQIKSKNIHYLFNDSVEIDNFKIWGSPFTPTFGRGWAWNISRHKIHNVWDLIPDDTDILVTHGPPKGILDYTVNMQNELENCGCSNLRKRILNLNLKACLFGHIHNCELIYNSSIQKLARSNTIFSNASCVQDGDIGNLISDGNIFELEKL